MARLLSQTAVIMRGSVGGVTYTANQFHQIIAKARIASAQFPTNFQTQFRASFGAASLDWFTLTPAQRAAWELFAPSVSYSGPLGSYTVPGRDIFLGARAMIRYLNTRWALALTIIPDPPVNPGRYTMLAATISLPAMGINGFTVNLTNNGTSPVAYIVNVSKPFPQSRMKWAGGWDSALQVAGLLAAGAAVFPIAIVTPGVGQAYFVQISAVTGSVVGVPHIFTTTQILRAVSSLGV